MCNLGARYEAADGFAMLDNAWGVLIDITALDFIVVGLERSSMLCIWERGVLLSVARQLALSLRCCSCGVDPAKIRSSLRNAHRIGADIGMKWFASVVSEQTQPRDRSNL